MILPLLLIGSLIGCALWLGHQLGRDEGFTEGRREGYVAGRDEALRDCGSPMFRASQPPQRVRAN